MEIIKTLIAIINSSEERKSIDIQKKVLEIKSLQKQKIDLFLSQVQNLKINEPIPKYWLK